MTAGATAWRIPAVAVLVWFGGVLAGVPLFPCPVRGLFGVGCPGCGLGRSMAATLQGNLSEALRFHLFGPLALIGAAVLIGLACLGQDARERARAFAGRFAAPAAAVLLPLLLLYWCLRLYAGTTP